MPKDLQNWASHPELLASLSCAYGITTPRARDQSDKSGDRARHPCKVRMLCQSPIDPLESKQGQDEDSMANYYEILQISPKASIEEIKAAFRRLARQYHPDMNPDDPTTAEKFRQIERAYQVLRDRGQRQQYDRETLRDDAPTTPCPASAWLDRGLQYDRERNYRQAIECYSRAIEIDPRLGTAYLKRAEAYYHNYQDRSVLEDCRQVLQLNPDCGQAYYYLGLARQRLGYTQSSIEAYHKAIALDPDPTPIYYQRGLAFEELADYTAAGRDFQRAAKGFQKAGDFIRYQSLQRKIKLLKITANKKQKDSVFKAITAFFVLVLSTIEILGVSLVDPTHGLSSAFARLDRKRALGMGTMAGIASGFCLASSWQNWSIKLPLEQLWLYGIVPFGMISLSSYIIRKLGKFYGHPAGDIFLGGFVVLPLTITFFITSRLPIHTDIIGAIIGIVSVYSAWIGYHAYTQLSNISSQIALLFLPFVLFFVGATLWGVYYYL